MRIGLARSVMVIGVFLSAAGCSTSTDGDVKAAPETVTSSVSRSPDDILAAAVEATKQEVTGWFEAAGSIPSFYFHVQGSYDLAAKEQQTLYRQALESDGKDNIPEFRRSVVSNKVYVKDEALSAKACWFDATDREFYNPPELHGVAAVRLLVGLKATGPGTYEGVIRATVSMPLVRDVLFGTFGPDIGVPSPSAGTERLRMPVTVEIEDGTIRNVLLDMEDAVSIVRKSGFALTDVFGRGADPKYFKALSLVGIAYEPGEPAEIAAPPADQLTADPEGRC